MAVSALDDGLIYTNQDAMMFYGHTAYHDFEGIARSVRTGTPGRRSR